MIRSVGLKDSLDLHLPLFHKLLFPDIGVKY